jgi:LPS-assembly lipoprotein
VRVSLLNPRAVKPACFLPGLLLAGWLIVSLSACGFQMRGSAALPEEMAVTLIKSSRPWGTLIEDFAEALRTQHVKVTEDREAATAVLVIISDSQEKDVLSVDNTGKVLEFQLRQSIKFAVTTSDDLPLLEPQRVTMTRDYLYSNTDVLSKEREEVVVRRALQRELVHLAMLRITAAAR